jgi:hypothetical protein
MRTPTARVPAGQRANITEIYLFILCGVYLRWTSARLMVNHPCRHSAGVLLQGHVSYRRSSSFISELRQGWRIAADSPPGFMRRSRDSPEKRDGGGVPPAVNARRARARSPPRRDLVQFVLPARSPPSVLARSRERAVACSAGRAPRVPGGPAAVRPGGSAGGGGLGRHGRGRREPGGLRAAVWKAGAPGRTGEPGAGREGAAQAAGRRTPRSARRIPRAATAGQRRSRPRTRCPFHGWPGRPCRSNPQEPSVALPGQ